MIGRFHNTYPEIDIELRLTSDIESINNDETDVSLRASDAVFDDVVARKLFRLTLGVYASTTYVRTVVPNAGPMGEGLSWIGLSGEVDTKNWVAQSPFPKANMRHTVGDGYMVACLLSQNCGMSYMPVLFERAFPDLCRMPNTELSLGPSLWILLHTDLQKTVRVRRFVDFLADEFIRLQKSL